MKITDYLSAYKGDLQYHYDTKEGIRAVNHMTCATPYFDTDQDYREYREDVDYAIHQASLVDLDEVVRVMGALIDTVARTTDLARVYNDELDDSFTMDEVLDLYQRLVLRAEVD